MSLEYKFLSQDEQDDIVATAIISREKEHHNYELNKVNYDIILANISADDTIPQNWPDHLKQYKGVVGEILADALKESAADYELVTKLQFKDRLLVLRATTISEQSKVEHVYKALHAQLKDAKRLKAAIGRVTAKEKN